MMPYRQLAMSTDIQPVRLSQLPELTEEFFGLGYRENRLGFGGLWAGSDMGRLGLDRSVDRETFGNIFSFRSTAGDQLPPREWREANPVIAQRINFTGNPLVSTLWGLGGRKECLALMDTRHQAMEQSMKLLQRVAVLESESNLPLLRRGCLYAAFLSGAAPDQTPRLETTILIAQQYRLPNGTEVHFPLVLAPGAVSELIARSEWRRLSETLGTFGLTERTQVPENLFTPPTLRDLRTTEQPLAGSVSDRRLAGPELVTAWRNQAAAKGFGREQVKAMFAAGQLLAKVVRWDRNNLGPEGFEAAYHAVARTGSRLSTATAEKEHSHGPSL
jgi:hypothetical protein